ncbi:unnamed protein product [Phyllotreta striolata]|uniref:PITH domain-containing protein n=1 Tax=Phyllotreta striolata TaxID=444603 RepID=A0A9N9TGQ2_PHYSR|nr:unnamed protein product [Phyllotreta striolata]
MKPHGECCGGASHHHEPEETGVSYSLYAKINKDHLQCLNEAVEGTGKNVFKPWEERFNFEVFVESDADEELLFNIPFVGNVKLKAIKVIGEDSDTHPSKMRLFKNRPSMTFDDTSAQADQEFELVKDISGSAEYNTKVVTFNSVNHLTLHFPSNFGAETTKIYYIGLKGEFTEAHHHGVTICTYEARPMMKDHKNPLEEITQARLGQ